MRKSNDEIYQLAKDQALVKKLKKNKRFRPFCLCPPDVMFVTRRSKISLFFIFDSLSSLDCGYKYYSLWFDKFLFINMRHFICLRKNGIACVFLFSMRLYSYLLKWKLFLDFRCNILLTHVSENKRTSYEQSLSFPYTKIYQILFLLNINIQGREIGCAGPNAVLCKTCSVLLCVPEHPRVDNFSVGALKRGTQLA